MDKITCDIIMDLIPLVKDGIASDDSQKAVYEHLAECDQCSELCKEFEQISSPKYMDEKRVLNQIKRKINIAIIVLTGMSILFGVSLTLSNHMFYNIIIMPIIGAVGYIALKKKSYLVPIFVFLVASVWHLFLMIGGEMEWKYFFSYFMMPINWGLIYAGLCALGNVVAFLFDFAFRKERVEGKS